MTQEPVFDIGEVEIGVAQPTPHAHQNPAMQDTAVRDRTTVQPGRRRQARRARGFRFDMAGTLSLFVPGAGQLAVGEWGAGLFFLSAMGFVGAMGWALVTTMDRLAPTLVLLGQSRAAGVWALFTLFGVGAMLHLGSVLSAERQGAPLSHEDTPPPGLAAGASLLIPGWGQVLNGHRIRGVLFLLGVWTAAAAWLLISAPVQELITSLNLYLPPAVETFSSTAVRWTFPIVLWSLAVYDAFSNASRQ